MAFMTKGNKFSAERGPGRYRGRPSVGEYALPSDWGDDRVLKREIEIGPPIPDVPLPPKPAGAVGVQPWGVLPAKPPGRSR